MLRILQLTPHLYPNVVGGIGISVHELSTELAKENEVTVACTWLGTVFDPSDLDYKLVAFPTTRVLAGNPLSVDLLAWLATHGRDYDIIHAHSHLFLSSEAAVLLSKVQSRVTVLTNHGLISLGFPARPQHILTNLACKSVLQCCDAIICYTREDAAVMESRGIKRSRIAIIPNGVDLKAFKPAKRSVQSQLRMLFLGRVAEEKGLDRFVRALASIPLVRGQIQLTIAGNGPLKERLFQTVLELNLASTVRFIGEVPYQRVPEVLAQHDVLVLPSITEGSPRVVLEAFATSMPVVCSRLNQLTSLYGDCATYFDPGSESDVAHAISWALNNRAALQDAGRRGRELVEKNHSLPEVAQSTMELYRSILRGTEKPSFLEHTGPGWQSATGDEMRVVR